MDIKRYLLNIKSSWVRKIKHSDFLESLYLSYLLIFGLIFGKVGYIIGTCLIVLIILYRIYKGTFTDGFFTFKLFLNSEKDLLYLFFGILNVVIFFIMLQLDYEEFWSYLCILAFKLVFEFQNFYVQNKQLIGMIEDLYNFGDAFEVSPLANRDTLKLLGMLRSIKDEFKESSKKQMEAEQFKTELITNISHDLKTPLTSIIAYTDILSKKQTMDEQAREFINVLSRNSKRLMELISDLIYASKTGSKNIKVEKSFIDFNELVLQIYGDFDEVLKSHGLEFEYEYPEEIVIYSDGNILSRIIQNLLSNCYRYSKENTIIKAKTIDNGDSICFEILNETKEKIELTQDDLVAELIRSEKSRTSEGSGLGLYITKNLIEILEGSFSLNIEDNTFKAVVILNKE